MTRSRDSGMTMIELLVAMAIGVGVVLAVSTLLVAGENHKRTTTSTNDADQAGSYTFHTLDKALRGAGSAIAESAFPASAGVLGCRLNAAGILPSLAAFPQPFDLNFLGGNPSNLRVAPVLIGAGQSDSSTSDVIMVMSGSGGEGGVSRAVYGSGSGTSVVLESSTGFQVNDLVLVSQPNITDCLLEQVTSITAPTLNVGGTYYTSGAPTSLATLATSTLSYVTPLGNAAVNDVQFMLFGVGTNYTMYSYDLLQNQNLVGGNGGNVSEAIADGVVQMNAIYGIQAAGQAGILGPWASPGTVAGDIGVYDINTVMTTPATQQLILAVRVAIVVRGEYYDKNVVSPATVTIFSGYTNAANNSLSKVVNLDTLPGHQGLHYRYRVFEFTVPLRNMLLLAGA